jgi:'Cold-shock' DNA-binding domain
VGADGFCLTLDVAPSAQLTMARGTVKWFNSQKGYAFIQPQTPFWRNSVTAIGVIRSFGPADLMRLFARNSIEVQKWNNMLYRR